MKAFALLLILPFAALAQQDVSCSKTSIFYSRELFPGAVTIERAVILSGFENDCAQIENTIGELPSITVSRPHNYQYYPIDYNQQDLFGREMSLGVDTDQLVNHLVFDRN